MRGAAALISLSLLLCAFPVCLSLARVSLSAVRALLPPPDVRARRPEQSLEEGTWVKLICGASTEDAALVRNLAVVYTLAGVSCVDVAADGAVVGAAEEGVLAGLKIAAGCGANIARPWLMVSMNDDETDPHFRKALFDPSLCPSDCPRPCERSCPAGAIDPLKAGAGAGVLPERCYGCGRCIPVCPLGLIRAESYLRSPEDVLPLFQRVDALEIHTRGDAENFSRLWHEIGPEASVSLRAVAVSFPDRGPQGTACMVSSLMERMGKETVGLHIWQADGRPMSGDIGRGTALTSVAMAQHLLSEVLFDAPQDYLQVAGGTNDATAPKLDSLDLRGANKVAGVAFGGYARKIVGQELREAGAVPIESRLDLLISALEKASALVAPLRDWVSI